MVKRFQNLNDQVHDEQFSASAYSIKLNNPKLMPGVFESFSSPRLAPVFRVAEPMQQH